MNDHRVERLREWVDDLDQEITQLQIERAAIRQAIDVLDRTNGKPVPFPPAPPDLVDTLNVGASTDVLRRKPGRPKRPTPPQTKADTKPKRHPPSTSKVPPLEEVARVYNEARAAGKATTKALVDHFRVPESSAKNWPSMARKAGLLDAQVTSISAGPRAPRPPAGTNPDKPGPPRHRDYTEIAQRITELRDAGKPVAPGLVEHYEIPLSTAKNWIQRSREMGLVKPLEANLRVVEDNTRKPAGAARFNADAVADTYLEAMRVDRRPLQAVVDRFDIDRDTAKEWIALCRSVGKLAPAGEPQLPEDERRAQLEAFKPEPVA